MVADEINAIIIDSIELSYEKKFKLFRFFSHLGNILDFIKKSKVEVSSIISKDEYDMLLKVADKDYFEKLMTKYKLQGIEILTFMSDNYPKKLLEIPSPPLCLYCKGNLQLLNSLSVSVVGTRHPSDYGKIITKKLCTEFAQAGLTIISGLATGVDTIAHKTALNEGTGTIAVIAGGHNKIYPKSNAQLFAEICKSNLVVSENPPDTENLSYLFPIRNRIIAALSDAVVITEASLKSGTMHTKNYAIEYNKDVFAVPGNINSRFSEGCNIAIKDLQAIPLLDAKQVFDTLNVLPIQIKQTENSLDKKASVILDYIRSEKKSFDDILHFTKLSSSELNIFLLDLELAGKVQKLAGNYYMGI